jgi:hypothetical protein
MTSTPRRLALVIATTEYDDSRLLRLGAPLADALELARTLKEHGDFDVETLINAEAQTVQRRIERFCKAGRQSADTILVYFTGHGVKDDDGNLYFALRDTDRDLLRTTAVSAELLAAVMDESPARSQLLMLDCCYSGAYARALRPKGEEDAGLGDQFASSPAARGRVVLAASGAIEQAWEEDAGSIYTRAVVDGIRTGRADLDGDGRITASELHAHVSENLRSEGRQTPRKFEFDDAGSLLVARRGEAPPIVPSMPAAKRAKRPAVRERQITPSNRKARAWIPGMMAVALAAVLGTLWLSGGIGFLPSPLIEVTTTAAVVVPPPPTAVASATTVSTAVEWQVAIDEQFTVNDREWAEGDFGDTSADWFFRFVGGTYEGGFTTGTSDLTYYSTVPFTPESRPLYIETETTSYSAGSQCGIALQNADGSLTAVGIGSGEVVARHHVENEIANSGSWPVPLAGPTETQLGLWIDGSIVTIYIDDRELASFDEPSLTDISAIGVGLIGGTDVYCGFDYIVAQEGD